MDKITYGAPRLVDWVAQIRAGAATVRVHFTGGALTAYGVTPAEYTTDNPFIQKVIEQSAYFKEGRIIFLRRTAIPGHIKPVKAHSAKKPERPQSPPAASAESVPETACRVDAEADAAGQTLIPAETDEPADDTDNDMTTVEAACLQDAQAYLQEKFNIPSYKVRTYEAAQRAASEHGVRFVGTKFDRHGNEEADGESTEEEQTS